MLLLSDGADVFGGEIEAARSLATAVRKSSSNWRSSGDSEAPVADLDDGEGSAFFSGAGVVITALGAVELRNAGLDELARSSATFWRTASSILL
ncbi:MAG: hypothetical protein HYY23_17870 [Verrucomicrobia bacterium]|nr:hypothetical protein [Verrucomicrobiota bacterium]